MRKTVLISLAMVMLAPAPRALNAGETVTAVSDHYRLCYISANGGQAHMASESYRMEAVVSPPLSGEMHSKRFRIRPLLKPPHDTPGLVQYVFMDMKSGPREH